MIRIRGRGRRVRGAAGTVTFTLFPNCHRDTRLGPEIGKVSRLTFPISNSPSMSYAEYFWLDSGNSELAAVARGEWQGQNIPIRLPLAATGGSEDGHGRWRKRPRLRVASQSVSSDSAEARARSGRQRPVSRVPVRRRTA
jgi:hypothetical protein